MQQHIAPRSSRARSVSGTFTQTWKVAGRADSEKCLTRSIYARQCRLLRRLRRASCAVFEAPGGVAGLRSLIGRLVDWSIGVNAEGVAGFVPALRGNSPVLVFRRGRISDADAVRQLISTIDQSVRRAATAPAQVGLDDRAQMRQCLASSASPPTKLGVVSPRMEGSNSKWVGGRINPVPSAFKQASLRAQLSKKTFCCSASGNAVNSARSRMENTSSGTPSSIGRICSTSIPTSKPLEMARAAAFSLWLRLKQMLRPGGWIVQKGLPSEP